MNNEEEQNKEGELVDKKKQPRFQLSVDTQALHRRYKKAEFGDVISYAEMNRIIGADVQKEARHIMESARKLAVREDGIVFDCIMGVGLKRLTDREINLLPPLALNHARRKCKRTLVKLHCIKLEALTDQEKISYIASSSLLNAIGNIATASKAKQLEQGITAQTKVLPVNETLNMFLRRE